MSNYTKATNFATKDALPTGNALKIVSGTEIDTEFSNIETAVNTKADTSAMTAADALKANIASPTFTGVPEAPTATAGTDTTQVATTAFAKAAADTKLPLAGGTIGTVPSAKYTKVGRMVHLQMYIEVTPNSGNGNNTIITGLPFTSASSGWAISSFNMATANADKSNFHTRVTSSSTEIHLKHGRDTTLVGTDVDVAHVIFSTTYEAT